MAEDREIEITDGSGFVLARLDIDRESRSGAPEAIFAQGKAVSETVAIAEALVERQGHALVTRAGPEAMAALRKRWPDLRVAADLILSEEKSVFCLTLREDGRQAQARFGGDGRVEISLNGRPSRPEARAVAALNPGQPHRVELYLVEGTARVFVDSESA